MTQPSPAEPSPVAAFERRPPLLLLLLAALVLVLAAAVISTELAREPLVPAPARPSPAPSVPASTRGQVAVRFDPAPPPGGYETAAPITVEVEVPAVEKQDEPGQPDAVLVELIDEQGNAAVFGPGPAEPQRMIPRMSPSGGRPVWIAAMSAPTRPGVYRARLIVDAAGVPRQVFEPAEPAIQVVDPRAPLTAGFVYQRLGNLWLTAGDGSRTRKLTFYPPEQHAGEPAWSPDGGLIAYNRAVPARPDQHPASDIWILDPLTGEEHRAVEVGPGEGLSYPAWTPGGDLLVTADRLVDPRTGATPATGSSAAAQETWTIFRVNRSTGERTALAVEAAMPHMSADGRLLTYVARTTVPGQEDAGVLTSIVAAEGDGGNPRVLVPPGDFLAVYLPRVSPDGRLIAFSAVNNPEEESAGDLWSLLRDALFPKAYAHEVPWDIYVVPVEGGTPRRVTRMEADQPGAAWGSDSMRLAVMADAGIFIVTLDGGNPQRVAPGEIHSHISWYEK